MLPRCLVHFLDDIGDTSDELPIFTRNRQAIRGEEILEPLMKTSVLDPARLASKIAKAVRIDCDPHIRDVRIAETRTVGLANRHIAAM